MAAEEPIAIPLFRDRWLEHHEQVLRSSLQTIDRYHTTTNFLHCFLKQRPVRHVPQFHALHAEEFTTYLRTGRVSSNGHNA
jgi:hypothetical protein